MFHILLVDMRLMVPGTRISTTLYYLDVYMINTNLSLTLNGWVEVRIAQWTPQTTSTQIRPRWPNMKRHNIARYQIEVNLSSGTCRINRLRHSNHAKYHDDTLLRILKPQSIHRPHKVQPHKANTKQRTVE